MKWGAAHHIAGLPLFVFAGLVPSKTVTRVRTS